MDVAEFLKERADEKSERADEFHNRYDCDSYALETFGECSCGYPQHVLREVEATRAVITLYRVAAAAIGHGPVAVMAAAVVRRDTLYHALATLASAHSAHPDYRQDWNPVRSTPR